MKRYDGLPKKTKKMFEELKGEYFTMVKCLARKCLKEFDFQYVYMGEQTALAERRLDLIAWHFKYHQILENITIKHSKQTHYLEFLWHIGVFAIGYSYLPSMGFVKYLEESSVWQKELEKLKLLKARNLE